MALKNPWIGYLDRSYEQIKAAVIAKFPARLPEITDHSENALTTKLVSIWAGLMEMLNYYLDKIGREIFLSTARRFASGAKFAQLVGYRVRGPVAASADITFQLSAAPGASFTIPSGTVVTTKQGLRFVTTAAATIAAGAQQAMAPARQWLPKNNIVIGYSDGTSDQTYAVEGNVVDNSLTISIGAVIYTPVETFIFSGPADTHFVAGVNESGVMAIRFGDGINGKIPPSPSAILTSYFTTEGTGGNVAAGTITEFPNLVPNIPDGLTLTAFNLNRASAGTDTESLEDLRKRIPLFIRTNNRAITRPDYVDIARMAPGVEQAGVEFACGKSVDIYVAPTGGGVASSILLQSVKDFFEDKRAGTTNVSPKSAGVANVTLRIRATAYANYANTVVRQNISDAVTSLLSVENQELRGTVVIGDIYQVIEAAEGVKNTVIELLNILPYARPVNHSNQLDWTRSVGAESLTVSNWSLKFTSPTVYQLSRDNVFKGLFAIGDVVNFNGVTFVVNQNQTTSYEYRFVSYPYNRGSVTLEEPSLPLAFEEDLDIIVTGGI